MSDWKFNKVSEFRGLTGKFYRRARNSAIVERITRQKETGNKYMVNEEEKGLFVVYAVTRYNEPCRTWEPVPAI
jgi:hypothetical protein